MYQIYLDLKITYDALKQIRCLKILAGYGVGPKLLHLQKQFWDNEKMVCCAGGNFGELVVASQGVSQGGGSLWPHVQCLCRRGSKGVAAAILGDNAAQGGMGEAVPNYIVAFFANDRLVAARCPEWLQSWFTILVDLFEHIGLWTNAQQRLKSWHACRGGHKLLRQRRSMAHNRQGM